MHAYIFILFYIEDSLTFPLALLSDLAGAGACRSKLWLGEAAGSLRGCGLGLGFFASIIDSILLWKSSGEVLWNRF